MMDTSDGWVTDGTSAKHVAVGNPFDGRVAFSRSADWRMVTVL